ncbi:hypothetical protein NF418_05155 [Streptococcus suis]|uniref:hypothetical protein n=1 Tax=Streptococcus suis TaxID=1307 RepID=UPI0021186231|nr:hypothetical protein [Streptococcus suis]
MKRYEHTNVFLPRGEIVSIKNLLNQGGEGAIFATNQGDLLAKIYHSQPPKDKIKKLKLLIDYGKQAEDLGIRGIAFPKELLYDNQKQVIGFLMKRCYGKEFQYVWRDFTRSELVAVVRKLCVYINFLHNNQIFIGDVSLGNILFDVGNKQQEFYFIDTDSFLVTGNYKMLGHTLPFEAPEMLKRVNGEVCIVENFQRDSQSDVFSVTVLLYHLLLLNDSPYLSVDSLEPILDGDVKFADWQEVDCNKNRARKNWHILPSYIRQLFMDILTPKGRYYQHRNRPSMEVWLEAIKRYEEELPSLIRKNACYGQLVPDSVPANTGASPVSSKSSPKNPFKDKFTGFASYRWSDGSVYKGHFDRGLRSGRGKMKWASGECYEGGYLNDKLHGQGKYTWSDGRVYEGEFLNGKLHGQGKYIWSDGRVYEGEFLSGSRAGQGTLVWSNGAKYEGSWQDGKRHGQGTMTYADGGSYTGNWQNDKRHGHGTMKWANGNYYEGEWLVDQRTGRGTLKWPNGARYEGGWQDGKRHGHGEMTYADGKTYKGLWKDGMHYGQLVQDSVSSNTGASTKSLPKNPFRDKITGFASYRWSDGSIYEGNFDRGLRSGRGKMTYADGRVYEGSWQGDRRHGRGKLTNLDGTIYEGLWQDDRYCDPDSPTSTTGRSTSTPTSPKNLFHDKFTGFASYRWSDGSIYEGNFDRGLRSGWGKMTYADGRVYDGDWRADQRSGQGVLVWTNGAKYEGSWRYDKRHGWGKITYADGGGYTGDWQNDKRHGQGRLKLANGDCYEGDWHEDQRTGYGKYVWPSGVVYEGDFHKGEIKGHGIKIWPDGSKYDGSWERDKRHGHGTMTYADGGIYTGEWREDKRQGHGKMTYADGGGYKGDWRADKRHGHGTMTYVSGSIYVGKWENDVCTGYGRTTWPDGR